MSATDDLKKWITFILAVLGIGGAAVATSAWLVPQTSVYAQLVTDTTWAYNTVQLPCVWEVHPNSTKTINSVSYGSPGNYTDCTQNSSDFLLWTCSYIAVSGGNQSCPQIKVVQNEFPGTSENLFNGTLVTPNINAVTGCLGSADCVVPGSNLAYNVTHRSITIPIGTTLTLANNTVIRAFKINNSGAIVVPAYSTVTFDDIDTFINSGTISGAGANIVFNRTRSFSNSGSVLLTGTAGSQGSPCKCTPSPNLHCGVVYGSAGTTGLPGGDIVATNSNVIFNNSGTINLKGGAGGDAGPGSVGNECDLCGSGIYSAYPIFQYRPAGTGGISGQILLGNSFQFVNSGTVYADAGAGGAAGPFAYCAAGSQGIGNNNSLNVTNFTKITGTMSATGIPNGQWSINTCGADPANNYSMTTPTAVTASFTCMVPPNAPSVATPNATSSYTLLLNNVTTYFAIPTSTGAEVWISYDNQGNWTRLVPSESDFSALSYNTTNYSFATSRLPNSTKAAIRVRSFNVSTGLYSAYANSSLFNVTPISTILNATSSPSGSTSTNAVTFSCNYTNSSNFAIEAATAYAIVDGVPNAMSYNTTSKVYYYVNTAAWVSGIHNWSCNISKANYQSQQSNTTNITLTGFSIIIAGGRASVLLTCPFPTMYGMTPAGQKAGIGIFRIQNNNATVNKNYTLFLNNTLPPGVTVYGRSDKFISNPSNYTGWTALSQLTGWQAFSNLNSTNASAYVWLKMDCIGATPGNYTPFSYVFNEQ